MLAVRIGLYLFAANLTDQLKHSDFHKRFDNRVAFKRCQVVVSVQIAAIVSRGIIQILKQPHFADVGFSQLFFKFQKIRVGKAVALEIILFSPTFITANDKLAVIVFQRKDPPAHLCNLFLAFPKPAECKIIAVILKIAFILLHGFRNLINRIFFKKLSHLNTGL